MSHYKPSGTIHEAHPESTNIDEHQTALSRQNDSKLTELSHIFQQSLSLIHTGRKSQIHTDLDRTH